MMLPQVKRFFKKCENEFAICSEIGDAGLLFTEYARERYTLYQIVNKGSGKIAKVFDSECEEVIKGEKILSLKKYIGYDTIFESYEPFHIFGFNTLNINQDWDGKLIEGSFEGDHNSWLVCFDGRPIINGKELKRMDYAKLHNKEYNVELNDSVVGVFTKVV